MHKQEIRILTTMNPCKREKFGHQQNFLYIGFFSIKGFDVNESNGQQ